MVGLDLHDSDCADRNLMPDPIPPDPVPEPTRANASRGKARSPSFLTLACRFPIEHFRTLLLRSGRVPGVHNNNNNDDDDDDNHNNDNYNNEYA